MKTKQELRGETKKPAAIENENQNKETASEPRGSRVQEWNWVSRVSGSRVGLDHNESPRQAARDLSSERFAALKFNAVPARSLKDNKLKVV
jgi:hypothetical protein